MRELTFRAAREADLDRIVEIHVSAFPDPRGLETRRRNFTSNPLGQLADLRLAVADGAIVGHAFLFMLDVWFGGARVSAGAIASVGVAPEARGEGVATSLLATLHEESAARGDPITLLYPFRQSFYSKLGYAAVTPAKRLAVHPAAFPTSWRANGGIAIRAANGTDRGAIMLAYERAAAKTTGWIARPDALWSRLFQDDRRVWLVAIASDRVAGYVAWSLAQSEPHAATQLRVHELAADDDEVRRALLGQLGAQRDQVAEVTLEVDAQDPLDRALLDADRARFGTKDAEHTLGSIAGGPMVRIGDLTRAIKARGYAHDGSVEIAIDDAPPLRIEARDGRGTVGPGAGAPCVRTDRTTLAALLYGGLSAREAVRLGVLTSDAEASLASADALFASPPYFAIDSF